MKNFKTRCIAIILYFFSVTLYAQNTDRIVKIQGNVLDYKNQKISLSRVDRFEDLRNEGSVFKVDIDSLGRFEINTDLAFPQYFLLGYNQLYLTPGDSLSIQLDLDYPEKTIYTGKNEAYQTYLLHAPFARSGSFLNGGLNIKQTREETLNQLFLLAETRSAELLNLKTSDAKFKLMETARIKADLINSLDFLVPYYNLVHKVNSDSADRDEQAFVKEKIQPAIKELAVDFVNGQYLDLTSYRKIVPLLSQFAFADSSDTNALMEWKNALTIVNDVNRGKYSSDSTWTEEVNERIKKLDNREIREELLTFITQQSNIHNGQNAIDITFQDHEGKVRNLQEYQGQLIYIDFWATWCGPCVEQQKYFKRLSEQFSNDDVVFLLLSIDDNEEAWRRYDKISSNKIVHARLEERERKKYNIAYIPRYVLIDRHFKLIDLHAPKPSSKDIQDVLRRQLAGEGLK